MRFGTIIARLIDEQYGNDPGRACDFIELVGLERYAEELEKDVNWKVKVTTSADGHEEFVADMLWCLMEEDIIPMVVSFYKSDEAVPFNDTFECFFSSNRDAESIEVGVFGLGLVEEDEVITIERVPWQDFCDVRRMMCTDHDFCYPRLSEFSDCIISGGDPLDCLWMCKSLPKLPASAA